MSFARRRLFLWILFLVGICLIALAARATTFARLRFEELAQEASAVARLRCLSVRAHWEKGEIWTDTQFEVVETQKGLLPGLVAVRFLGGRVGHIDSRVDGTPRFEPGEEVYLFLWGGGGEPYRVLGWTQGTFRIVRDPRTGRESVSQESAAMAVFEGKTRTFQHERVSQMPVEQFRVKLRRALAAVNPR